MMLSFLAIGSVNTRNTAADKQKIIPVLINGMIGASEVERK